MMAKSKTSKDPAFGQEVTVAFDKDHSIKGSIIDQDDDTITLFVADLDNKIGYEVQITSSRIESIWIERKDSGDDKQ